MSCQYPNCSHSIHSICANHCHWSLCEEHINEHKTSLVIEFEEVLQDLIKPTNECTKSIEEIKQRFNEDQQRELNSLKQSHQKQMHEIDQQLIEINKFQNEFNQISEDLIRLKNNENILTQNHFQQIDILSKEITQYKNSLADKEENLNNFQSTQIPCPLTSLNIYGLLSSHNLRLCSPNKKLRNLFDHFRNYHHLTNHYANELIKAIKLNLDPMETKIFPPDVGIIALDDKQPCPLHNTSKQSGIRSTPCTSIVTEKLIPLHLKTVHRLRLPQIKEILRSN